MNVIYRYSIDPMRRIRCNQHQVLKVSMASKAQMIKVVYRQGLRWCNENQTNVSLSQFIAPKVFESPLVDNESLKRLFNDRDNNIRKLLPVRTILEEGKLIASIEKVSEIRDLWRAIFHLNADEGNDRYKIQLRIDAAFLTLRELKKITEHLRDCEAARESHLDSEGVNFHIGQVVQHKEYKWRGVIAGWEKTEESLHQGGTTKSSIHYTLLQDSGDAILMGKHVKNQVPVSKMAKDGLHKYQILMVEQSDLRLLDDTLLCRVRNKDYSAFFDGYDAFKNCFKPNDATKYEYRMEDFKSKDWDGAIYSSKSTETSNAAKDVIQAVQSLATRFENRIQETEGANTFLGSSSILNDLQESLFRLSRGDILCDSERLKKDVTVEYVASLHLKELRKCSLLVSELFSQRRSALESRNGIQFQLGDIVQHKLYGFRGVVVGWDAKPVRDMSDWYDTFDIENPNEKPYYRIQTNSRDCEHIFGSERPLRYVCQDNLEFCPPQRRLMNIEMNWQREESYARYIADDESKFAHGEGLRDDDMTEKCLFNLYKELNEFQLSQRGIADHGNGELQELGQATSIEALFSLLKNTETMDAAFWIAETIKDSWKAHPSVAYRIRLDDGIACLLQNAQQGDRALDIFQMLVRDDPHYGEAWNMLATCYYVRSEQRSLSKEAAQTALSFIPQHFQAMSILGLIQCDEHQDELAALTFRKVLALDPWSQVSTKLAQCLQRKSKT